VNYQATRRRGSSERGTFFRFQHSERSEQPWQVAGNLPPHNLDAEAAVLSAMMLDPRTIAMVRSILDAADLYSTSHCMICEAIYALDSAKRTVDLISVAAWLRDRDALQKVGGAVYLGQLADATPSVANVSQHARIVAEKSWMRRMIELLWTCASEGYGDVGDTERWLTKVSAEVSRLVRGCKVERAATMTEAANEAMDMVTAALDRGGIMTGLDELDRATGGLHSGEVTLVTGPTGRGKTSLATTVILNVASASPQNGVLVFSLEQPKAEITMRMACSCGHIDAYHVLRRPDLLDQVGHSRLVKAMSWVTQLPIRIDDRKNLSPEAIRARALQVKAEMEDEGGRLVMIVVDHALLTDWRAEVGPRGSKYEGLGEVGLRMVELAEEAECAIWMLAQLNKDEGIRDCPLLEQHSHSWLNIRREKGEAGETRPIPAELKVKKQRNGADGVTAACWWHGQFLLFSDQEYLQGG